MNQTKISKILLALFTVVFCFGPVGQAEPIGTAFTYQGRLIDANQAADGLYDFQFKLFDEETVGSQLGQDVNTPEVDVIDGYFTVELDFGVVFDGNERWLDIGVRPGDLNDPNAYTVLSPRQEVTASPYALHAKSADSVKEGVSWAQVSDRPAGLDDGDDIGITTETDPTVAASVKDGVDWTEVTSRPAGLDDGDDVGITVESDPTVPASVKDGVTWSEVSDRPAGLDDGDDDTQLSEAQVDAYTANNGYLTSESDPTVLESVKDGVDWSEVTSIPAGFADGNDDTGDNDWTISDGNMYSAVAGNVGIGTTTPTAKLEVNGNIRTAGIYETVLYGHTWTAKESNRNWWSVAMSEGGTIQTAVVYGGQIYVSTDSGNIWTTKESNGNWRSVAMSADGTKQTAVGYYGKIYVSMDTGNTWTPKESNREWYSVAMSADGTKQTAVVEFGQIYVSTDTGNTWAAKESNRDWRSVAMSDDGTIQTAVFYGGQIYVSTDTGNTWTPKELNRDWMSVAMSADGTTQAAVVYNGKIYVSTDTGNTWTAKESDRYWMSVAMSADGTKQTAVVYNGQIYVSTDTGNNWTTKESNKNWMSVAMSADASVQTAVVYGGQIYVSYAGGSVGVGIGTTSPSQKLDVAGNAAFSGNVGIGTTSPRDMLDIQGSSFMPLVILENTNTTDGHVGIKLKRGNSDAESSISFRNPDETEVWKVGMDNAPAGTQGDFAIKTTNNASAEFTVKSSGNVGIGTTSPAAKLEVSGQVKITGGAPGTGKILTSDSNGLATWQTPAGETDPTVLASVKDGVDWTEVTGIPAGFADGVDDVGLTSETDPTVLESVKDGVGWTEVTGIPAGFADGVDDVGFTSETDPTVLESIKDGVDWTEVTGIPAGFADGNDDAEDNDWTISDGNMYSAVDGNVGIGTTSPTQKLHLRDTGSLGLLIEADSDNSGEADQPSIVLSQDGGLVNGKIGFFDSENKLAIYNSYGDDLKLGTNNNSSMIVIRSFGNVGIGTTSPTAKLEVRGNIKTAGIYESGYAESWMPKGPTKKWYSVAMSADGTKQTAVGYIGQIYVSTDSGNNWTAKESNRDWRSVAMSADGTKQTAVVYGGQIYVSTDYGNNWTPKESNRNWRSVAMSDDGTIQTAVVYGGQIYVSTDSGNNWTPKESDRVWISVAMSADGQIQTAVVPNDGIYISTDSGNTWTSKFAAGWNWTAVAMSADGTIQTAVGDYTRIFVSMDSGNTWSLRDMWTYDRWRSVAMSADGTKQTAGLFGGQIYVSTDFGDTWQATGSDGSWQSVAMSADGTKQTAVDYDGTIYVSYGGNVGIGTTSPRSILDIQGSSFMPLVILENTNTTDGHVGIQLKRGNSDAECSISFRNPDETEVWKVGMDNDPAGTQGDFAIKTTNNASAEFTVKSSGNVGIGTTSPVAALDVNGTVKILAWHDQVVDPNGYTWVGNILFQWGTEVSSSDDSEQFTFPIAFPHQCFTVNPNLPGMVTQTTTTFNLDRINDYDGNITFTYMAIGH